jgi:DNA-binding NarL/FixJ family response regulator
MTTTTRTRVLLADDHTLVRRGLRMILEAEPDLEVVAEAGDGAEAVRVAGEADLAVLDVSMPRMTGLQAAAEIGRRYPDVRCVLLSMHSNEQYLCEAAQAGAEGYVLKSAVDEELVSTCRAASSRGAGFVFPHGTPEAVRERVERAAAGDATSMGPLTEREREVLKLIAEGHSGQQIASMLYISEKTVDRHRSNLLEKLGLRDRVDLTRYAIRIGLVEA